MFVKVLVAGVIIGIELILFWLIMWQPVNQQIVSLNGQIKAEQAKYQQYQAEAQNLEKWEQAKVAFQGVLQKLHQTPTPVKDFIPSFLIDIEKLAKVERETTGDSSFQVTTITPGEVQVEQPQTGAPGTPQGGKEAAAPAKAPEKKVPGAAAGVPVTSGQTVIQLNFKGRFATIVDFLQQLGNFKLNKLVTIQRISMSPGGKIAPGQSPTLTVNMPFQVYMLGGG